MPLDPVTAGFVFGTELLKFFGTPEGQKLAARMFSDAEAFRRTFERWIPNLPAAAPRDVMAKS